jgi:hypothetical protein
VPGTSGTKPSKHRSRRRQGITAVLWTTLENARVEHRENRQFDPRRAAEHRTTGKSGFRHAPGCWITGALAHRSETPIPVDIRTLGADAVPRRTDHGVTPISQTRHRQVPSESRLPNQSFPLRRTISMYIKDLRCL